MVKTKQPKSDYIYFSFSMFCIKWLRNAYTGTGKCYSHISERPALRYDFDFFNFLMNLKPNTKTKLSYDYINNILWLLMEIGEWDTNRRLQNLYFDLYFDARHIGLDCDECYAIERMIYW